MRGLFRDFLAHLKSLNRADATIRKWQGIYNVFCDHFRHDDVTRVTKADVRAWRDKLLEDRGASTVKRAHLPAISAAFSWAVEEDRLPENPAKGVKQVATKTTVGRPKGFSDAEALAIIKYTCAYRPKLDEWGRIREAEGMTRTKQWVPILCALTGARVAEVTQLRCEDVREEDGVHFLRITPDAGGNKSHQYRDVPLHDQIVKLGFLKVVEGVGAGPLFYDGEVDYTKAQRQGNRLATWLRGAGLVPEGLQPNHAWRHRFQTLGRRYSQSEMVINAICGHGRQGDVSHS
ncbi:hypothetical protein [Ponticoccus alexandrii]|uniref:Core-binding (CB) domain-containing protein n=1 Tax=Ponticoccus alexandrii TaxID=1943633 RepID=A0ABX7F9C0_9RHOB|nr:hypothetical protein [Ponticoccus alexandrii]QRF66397.1 hypothetical protein GQA70_08785 [Ponticoccus alexandrii]